MVSAFLEHFTNIPSTKITCVDILITKLVMSLSLYIAKKCRFLETSWENEYVRDKAMPKVCDKEIVFTHNNSNMDVYIYIYIYICGY